MDVMSRRDGGSFRGITRRPCPCMLDVKVGHGIHHGKRTGTQYTRVRVSLLSIATAKSSLGPRGHWRDCVQTGKPPTMAEFSCFSLSISPTLTQLCLLSHCPPRALAIVSVAELVNGRCLRCQYRRHDDWTRGPPVIGWTTRVRPARVSRRVPVPRAESLHPMIPSTQQATNLDGFEVAIHRPFLHRPQVLNRHFRSTVSGGESDAMTSNPPSGPPVPAEASRSTMPATRPIL